MSYHWPGNVRELENCIERAIILCTDGVIRGGHLPPNLQMREGTGQSRTKGAFKDIIMNVEREIICEELKKTGGNMAKAARALAVTERIIGLKVAKYNIDVSQFKSG